MSEPLEEIYLKQAKKFYSDGRYNECIDSLKYALKFNGQSYEGHYYYGCSLFKQQKLEDAEKYFKKCLEIDTNKIEAYVKLLLLYDNKGDEENIQKFHNIIINKNPDDKEFCKYLAQSATKKKEYAKASKLYGKVASQQTSITNRMSSLIKQAECLYLIYKNKESLAILEQFEAMQPKDKTYYVLLIKVHINLFNIEKAKALIESSSKAFPKIEDFKSFEIYLNLILAKYNDVIRQCSEYFSSKKKNELKLKNSAFLNRIIFCLACSFFELGYDDKFKVLIDKYNSKFDNAEYYLSLAKYYFKNSKLDQCDEYLENAFQYSPYFIPGILLKIKALISKKEFEEAKLLKLCLNKEIKEYVKNYQKYINKKFTADFEDENLNLELPDNEKVEKKLLGKGLLGEIYEEFIEDQKVACRYIFLQNDEIKSKLAKMICSLKHENILGIEGVLKKKIMIEYAEGGSIQSLIYKNNLNLSTKFKLIMIMSIAEGIQHLHSNNIIHGNLSTKNILLNKVYDKYHPLPVPKISDFFYDLIMENKKTINDFKKILYWAPEVLSGNKATKESDIFSFGLIMFEIFFKKIPYEGDSKETVLNKKNKGIFPTALLDSNEKDVMEMNIKSSMIETINLCCVNDPAKRPNIESVLEKLKLIASPLVINNISFDN